MATKSKKPTLVFIHGLRGDHHGLRFVADILEKDGYKVINEDLPGYGKTPAGTPQTFETHLAHIRNTIANLPGEPVLVAHSMGSILASHYLEKNPDAASSAVLLAPIFRTRFGVVSSRLLYDLLAGFLRLLPPKPRDRLLRSKPVSITISRFLTADRKKRTLIDDEHLTYSAGFASAASLTADIKISMTRETKVLSAPKTLYIVGEKDRLTSLKTAKKRLKSTKILKDTGHLLNYERPEKVAALIRTFLEN